MHVIKSPHTPMWSTVSPSIATLVVPGKNRREEGD